ncbi:MAG: hypothetical protein EXR98_17125 [Gemmataceae bacterium]|nr:hypothetical protein [Gemmataceae bacterium]
MGYITATELQLLECFGVEPALLDLSNVPWCYNDALYQVEIDGYSISFTLHPVGRDVRLEVQRGNELHYELNALAVKDVRVLDEPGRDILEIEIADAESLRLQLRPSVQITHLLQRWTYETRT